MNKRIVHDALILTAFTLVLGLILGAVYGITKDRIVKADYEKAQKAYKAVFSTAEVFEEYAFNKEQADSLMEEKGYKDEIKNVQIASDADGLPLGYVITVKAKDGSQGSITFSVGIQTNGTVNGYSITEISETPGLGMKATEKDFSDQFVNKAVKEFQVVKSGAKTEDQITAITGSTITSKAIANGCNAAITYFNALQTGGVQ